MNEYQEIVDPLIGPVAIRRNIDGASIPLDPANRDYRDYLAWRAQQQENGQ